MDKDVDKNLPEDTVLLLSKAKEKIAESYYPLYEFDYNLTENEKYQAVHRARPFIDNKAIFIFGDVPQKIRREFSVVDLGNKESSNYFYDNYSGVYPFPLFEAINRLIIRNPSLMSER